MSSPKWQQKKSQKEGAGNPKLKKQTENRTQKNSKVHKELTHKNKCEGYTHKITR